MSDGHRPKCDSPLDPTKLILPKGGTGVQKGTIGISPNMKALRERSGEITSDSPLVSFLYELMRDHVPVGVVEHLMTGLNQPCQFCNGWLASYAMDIAKRLTGNFTASVEHNDPVLGPLVVQKYILQRAKTESKASDIPPEYRGIVLALCEQGLVSIPQGQDILVLQQKGVSRLDEIEKKLGDGK